MTVDEAKDILARFKGTESVEDHEPYTVDGYVHCEDPFMSSSDTYNGDNVKVCLDGYFTVDELEAIAVVVRSFQKVTA